MRSTWKTAIGTPKQESRSGRSMTGNAARGHYAIAAKHESEQKATTLLLTAVNLSRQLEAERMVAYGRCFGVVCEGRLFLPCHAVRRAVGDDPEGLEPDCVGDWMALFGPQGASPCPGEFLYCWATQQPWSGNWGGGR